MTKDQIVELLRTDKRAVARALVVLTNRQTSDEQASEHTRYLNGRGFRPCHAKRGTSMAKFFLARGFLSDKQIAYWRAPMKCGNMRIGIYAGQLLEEVNMKAAQRATPSNVKAAVSELVLNRNVNEYTPGIDKEIIARDLGNDMERRQVLEYELGMVMDSDDEKLIAPIKDEIDEIDAFWKKIRPNG